MAGRKAIHIEGFKHGNPIPNAAVIGNILASGAIMPRDSRTNTVPDTFEGQIALVFQHMKDIVEAAGGTTDDILKINVALKDPSARAAVNDEWLKYFPDEPTRPARHTSPIVGDSPYMIQIDFMAVLQG